MESPRVDVERRTEVGDANRSGDAASQFQCAVHRDGSGAPVQIVFPSVQQRQNGVKDHLLKLLRADVQIALACGIQRRNEYLPEPLDFIMVRLKVFFFSCPARTP